MMIKIIVFGKKSVYFDDKYIKHKENVKTQQL